MRTFFLLICCWLLSVSFADAQKIIQMDMFGKQKVMRFKLGDKLRFKVKGDDKFYELPIVDLDEVLGKIILPEGEVFLSQIAEIQVFTQTKARYRLGRKLFSFGTYFLSIGIVDAAVYGSVFSIGGLLIGGAALVTGALLRWGLKKRTFKINKKRQIRILNLTMENLSTA